MSDVKASMRRIYDEVFTQGNVDLIDELLADDFVEHEELPPGIPPGKEAPKAFVALFHGAFPDFRATVEEMLQDGNKVITRARFSGTHRGEFMGIPATGNSFDIPAIDIVEFRDDKAVAHWGVMDLAGMMEQLGVGGPPE
ncbi:MAG: ester cyclase [Thermoleophilia bacterium]|nr:ester cyclase [Thermoleophilia bacterium]